MVSVEATSIDLGTFAIIISILVGIVTIWSAIRAAKQQAEKASRTLEDLRAKTNSDMWQKINEMRERLTKIEIQFENFEKSLNRIEQFSWGRDNKSEPSWLSDRSETDAHKRKPETGMFKDLEDNE